MKMKLKVVGLWVITLMIGQAAWAQEEGFTTEDYTKYATVMKWAEEQTALLSEEVSAAVQNHEVMSVSAYNTLTKALKAGEDLNAQDVPAEEVAAFIALNDEIEAKKAAFTEEYKGKIMDEIGASLYNRLRKALTADAEVKAAYEAVYNSLTPATDDSE